VDELCSEARHSVKKVKEIAPQVGFELTPLEERSYQVKSSTTELQRHLKEDGKNLDYIIIYAFSLKIRKRQYQLLFQHFSTIFDSNLKIEAKTPKKNCFSIYDRVIASGSNICHCFLYTYIKKYLKPINRT
jgi:hypothetical protein